MTFEPLDIIGVVSTDVGAPRNDGTPGSGLYSVPIRLSRELTYEEGVMLTRLWDQPPQFTTMHRPGTASVAGDRFLLSRTTIEEVAKYHNKTLRSVVDAFNEAVPALLEARAREEARKEAEAEEHRRHVDTVASDIRFD